jgi:hypothetical protein
VVFYLTKGEVKTQVYDESQIQKITSIGERILWLKYYIEHFEYLLKVNFLTLSRHLRVNIHGNGLSLTHLSVNEEDSLWISNLHVVLLFFRGGEEEGGAECETIFIWMYSFIYKS